MSCNSFEVYDSPKQPQECNDMYTFMSFTSAMTGVFNKGNSASGSALTLLTMTYADCKKARLQFRKDKRRKECIYIIYGGKLLPKNENYRKYADFMECNKL